MDANEEEERDLWQAVRCGRMCPECGVECDAESNGGSMRGGDLSWLHLACGTQWDAIDWTEAARDARRMR